MGIRFILVEGNECTGKTTLVEALRGVLRPQGWDAKDLVHRPGDQFLRYLTEYSHADRVIFNRSHFAEHVFAGLYRSGSPFSSVDLEMLGTIVRKYGLVVYCDLPVTEIKKRLDARNQREILGADDTSLAELTANAAGFQQALEHESVIRYTPNTPADLRKVLEVIQQKVLGTEE